MGDLDPKLSAKKNLSKAVSAGFLKRAAASEIDMINIRYTGTHTKSRTLCMFFRTFSQLSILIKNNDSQEGNGTRVTATEIIVLPGNVGYFVNAPILGS